MLPSIETPDFINAVEVWRGPRIESLHRAAACVVDHRGEIHIAKGNLHVETYPRSSLKPLQALPLVETGAFAKLGLTSRHLALACASHGGEPVHTELADKWLQAIGLSANDLACGPHPPTHNRSAHELYKAGTTYTRIHNNCSGKHTGMLAVCQHRGWPIAGYEQPDHPLQAMIAARLQELAERDDLPSPGIDGCSLPNWPIQLRELALIMAKLAAGGAQTAGRQILAAMAEHPYLVAGAKRACTAIMQAAPHLTVKTGAEGVYIAAYPGRGLGLALKVEDGATRASEAALVTLLIHLGWLDHNACPELARPVLRNAAGLEVGALRAAPGWTA